MHAALFSGHLFGALSWDPQIRGALIVLTGILILPGSVYLLLATNMGGRIGFLLAVAGLSGWIAVMSVIWMVYGIGLKGRDPTWKPLEVVTGDFKVSTVGAVNGFPKGWKRLPPDSAELADAQAAVDKLLVKSTAAPAAGAKSSSVSAAFPPMFSQTTDYLRINGYRKGGDNPLFTIRHHKFYLRHSPHYEVIMVRPVIAQLAPPPFGGAPPKPTVDETKPVTTVVMVRDLGSIRFPPFVIAVSSLLIFGITCNVLHRRDKEIWKAKAAADRADAAPAPAPAPEPAGV